MFLLLEACNHRGRSKTSWWLESLYFEVNEHRVKKKKKIKNLKQKTEHTLICEYFLSPTHSSLKNAIPGEYNSLGKQEGWWDVQSCSNANITAEPPAGATATAQVLQVSQGSVWATYSAASSVPSCFLQPLLSNSTHRPVRKGDQTPSRPTLRRTPPPPVFVPWM